MRENRFLSVRWLRAVQVVAAVAASAAPPAGAAAFDRVVHVATADQLTTALADAQPGDVIELADGTYYGRFAGSVSGTAQQRITLHGSRDAVLDGGSVDAGYAFYLTANYWTLDGFTITHAKKGVMTDAASYNVFDDLHVTAIGQEAIHLRTFSRSNLIVDCEIDDTGLTDAGYGEGIYIGSAVSNWDTYTDGEPDTSDYNRVLGNSIGPNVRAEAIDIKEGTRGGEIAGNSFDGTGMSGVNHADSWIDVKGNGYNLHDNTGVNTLQDGFQVHVVVDGWGRDNYFIRNIAGVDAPGYGFYIQANGTDAHGNVVCADNGAIGAGSGIANIALTPAPCVGDRIFLGTFDPVGE